MLDVLSNLVNQLFGFLKDNPMLIAGIFFLIKNVYAKSQPFPTVVRLLRLSKASIRLLRASIKQRGLGVEVL